MKTLLILFTIATLNSTPEVLGVFPTKDMNECQAAFARVSPLWEKENPEGPYLKGICLEPKNKKIIKKCDDMEINCSRGEREA